MRILWIFVLAALTLGGCRRADAKVPELGQVAPFALTNQDGRSTTRDALRGQVWAAAFFFTRCPTVCPQLMKSMKALQEEARTSGVQLHLVAFSVDPDHDRPPQLRAFAKKYGADLATWSFVTGDPAVVEALAENFKIAVEGVANPQASDFGILHGSHLVLVDKELQIRGYYRVRDAEERARLLGDAARLQR